MKITRVEAIPVRIPVKRVHKSAGGLHALSPYVLVRVHTDEGLVGLGEATVTPRWSGETSPSCVAALEGLLAPELVGRDPASITALSRRMDRALVLNPFTKAAVEMALWDLAGKRAGLPLYELLGGKVREEVPIKMGIGAYDVPRAVALAKEFLDSGARCLKIKVGVDPEEDVERVKAVRQVAGPGIPIGVDANQGWSFGDAVRTLRRLEECDLLFAEQPIAAGDPTAMAELRRATPIPLMADESVFTLSDAWQLASLRAVDILSVYPGKHGGIAATLAITQIARAAGLACVMGSNLELGIATAAMLHLAVAVPAIESERYPADIIGPLYQEADVLEEPLSLGPPSARPPEGPGLGVTLSEEKLERYRDDSRAAVSLGADA